MRILNNMLVSVDEKDITNGVLTIPNGVEIIANDCLRSNDYIKVVNCPPTLKKIGSHAFHYSPLEMINFNEGLLEIEDCAFLDSKIRMAYLPDSLEYLGDSAFEYLKKLRKIDFCPSLKKIGDNTFSNNSRTLIELNFNDGLIEIGNNTFR